MAGDGVFGIPIDEKFVRKLPEYMNKAIITEADKAKVARELKNVDGKEAECKAFVENLKKVCGEGIWVMCMVYNATGGDLSYVLSHDWHERLRNKPYPLIIKNGQWAGWLYLSSVIPSGGGVIPSGGGVLPPGVLSSGAGVVYRGKNLEGKPKDWLQSWEVPFLLENNLVHAEARDAGYYANVDWTYLQSLLTPGKSMEVKDGCISEAMIGTGSYPFYTGFMGVTPFLNA